MFREGRFDLEKQGGVYESYRCSSYTNVRLEESQYLSGFQLI